MRTYVRYHLVLFPLRTAVASLRCPCDRCQSFRCPLVDVIYRPVELPQKGEQFSDMLRSLRHHSLNLPDRPVRLFRDLSFVFLVAGGRLPQCIGVHLTQPLGEAIHLIADLFSETPRKTLLASR